MSYCVPPPPLRGKPKPPPNRVTRSGNPLAVVYILALGGTVFYMAARAVLQAIAR